MLFRSDNEHMKALFEASDDSSPTACEMYAIEFQAPTSSPALAAARLVGIAFFSSASFSLDSDCFSEPDSPTSHGRVASDARAKRNIVLIPTGTVSSSILTQVKLVP